MENDQHPSISIIIPVYKVEEYLYYCVDSVLAQTYKNLEIILVDDGSPDNCGKICDEYAEKDNRIVVIHKENGGLSDARNAGLDIAKGDYIGFVDSDDYIAPNMYEVLMQGILNNNADISICGYYNVYDTAVPNYSRRETKVLPASNGLKEIIYSQKYGIMAWTKLYKADIFKQVRYPKGHVCEDVYVIADIFKYVKKAAFNSTPLYYYVHRAESISTATFKQETKDWIYSYEHMAETINEYFPELKKIAKIRLLWGRMFVLDKSVHTNETMLNKQIQKYIRKNIRYIFDPFFTSNRRLMAFASCISLKLYKLCIDVLKKNV